jgi:para-aminobenzoate synthetase/4-amino-4-deoxychorismate lyase
MAIEAVLFDPETRRWSVYREPLDVVSVSAVDDVASALEDVEAAVETRGLTAVGAIAYEAAPAFDPANLVRCPVDGRPLAVFGLFDSVSVREACPIRGTSEYRIGSWRATESQNAHVDAVERIRDRIAVGDTYQVNHTFRLRASFTGDPKALLLDLVRAQPDSLAAYLDLGELVVCSASPELFFELDGESIASRPMKGTAARGHDTMSDRRQLEWLRSSAKNRAENAMIVDMVRNDLGRVSRVGSISVRDLFAVERHPTVFQMTSTVEARTDASVADIIGALFPFASVTGAPKIRTMKLIRELENEPRGFYTGAIGRIEPARRARFAVAIRTAVVDSVAGEVEYGVGGGIVWDSNAGDEYRECVTKARILSEPMPDFELLETLLWDPDRGLVLLDRHLNRMADAAEFFCRRFDAAAIRADLERRSAGYGRHPMPVRLLVAADGSHRIEAVPEQAEAGSAAIRVALAESPVDPEDPFLHFKTTNRRVYDTALESRPGCDDVLLWNDRGEVTESTIANVVVKLGDGLFTPPLECGLLAGTLRAELLERNEISERIIRVDELGDAEEIHLINSVQGWRRVELVT